MPREAGLGIGLGHDCAGEHVGDGAFAGAGAADDGDVQRKWCLTVEERSNGVAHCCRGETQFACVVRLVGLPATVVFQPGEVFAELAGQGSIGQVIHALVLVFGWRFAAAVWCIPTSVSDIVTKGARSATSCWPAAGTYRWRRPAWINNRRYSTRSGRFMLSTSIVVRPMAVRPISSGPFQAEVVTQMVNAGVEQSRGHSGRRGRCQRCWAPCGNCRCSRRAPSLSAVVGP